MFQLVVLIDLFLQDVPNPPPPPANIIPPPPTDIEIAGAGVQLQREEDATLFVIGHQRSLRENDSPSDEDVRILHNRRERKSKDVIKLD